MDSASLSYSALVVDDSAHMRFLIMNLLRKHGISRVESALNGAEGLRKYRTSKADIVFLDAIMPEMDGLEALKEIKKLDPHSIIVMMTSISEKEKVLQFKDAGASYYLLKPFEDEKFKEAMSRIVVLLDQRSEKG